MAIDTERIKSIASWGYLGEVVVAGITQILEGPFRIIIETEFSASVILGGGGNVNKLVIKQGEVKTLSFTVQTIYGGVIDLTDATLLLGVKRRKTDAVYIFSHEDADFDKTQADIGIVKVDLTAIDTGQTEDDYFGELKCSWAGPPEVINKSADFIISIKRSITF